MQFNQNHLQNTTDKIATAKLVLLEATTARNNSSRYHPVYWYF